SGAYINVSDGITPERIVTLTGTLSCLAKAITMINQTLKESNTKLDRMSLRVVVPAVQCGSIIGKFGSKIKRIREVTNASIQINSELLPNSTEKIVSISGNDHEIEECLIEICKILMECPLKADPIPYRPYIPINHGSLMNTVTPQEVYEVVPCLPKMQFLNGRNEELNTMCPHSNLAVMHDASQWALNIHSKQLIIPNVLIGCIIGKGGQKISEIRQTSGASIKIADLSNDSKDRNVTLNGTVEQISLAEAMIQSRIANEIGGISMNLIENHTSQTDLRCKKIIKRAERELLKHALIYYGRLSNEYCGYGLDRTELHRCLLKKPRKIALLIHIKVTTEELMEYEYYPNRHMRHPNSNNPRYNNKDKNMYTNISKYTPSEKEEKVLALKLNFNVTPREFNRRKLISCLNMNAHSVKKGNT
ncbi:hypothetical protein GJ496_008382, partial [Pomphorhynchus laevis]